MTGQLPIHPVPGGVVPGAWRGLGQAIVLAVFVLTLVAAYPASTNSPATTNLIDPQLLGDNPQVNQLVEAMQKEGIKTGSLLDEHFLFASLIWGSVGAGYLLYARRQRMIVPFLGGVSMIAVSYLVASWLWMSIACIALMAAVYHFVKQEY